MIFAQPLSPESALSTYIQQARRGYPQLRFVGSKDLPGLPAALRLPATKNQRGVGIKVTYQFHGKPVDEEFYALRTSNV